MAHLDFDELMAAAEAALGATGTASAPAHLGICRPCADEVETWRRLLVSARSDRSGEPSARAVGTAHRLFDRQSGIQAAVGRIARWVAELTFDSGGLAPAAAGARGAAPGMRQLLFQAAGVQLDVAYPTEAGPRPLRGQAVWSSDDADPRRMAWRPVTLTRADAVAPNRLTSTDDDGGFQFERIEPGDYQLRLELEDGDLVANLVLR